MTRVAPWGAISVEPGARCLWPRTPNTTTKDRARCSSRYAVICLLSALQVHGLTSEAPHAVWVLLERSARQPKVGSPTLEVVRASGAAWEHGIETAHIAPGKPWQNGANESFNGRFRDECLNMEWFRNRSEAAILIEAWRRHYNSVRPHSSIKLHDPERVQTTETNNPRRGTSRVTRAPRFPSRSEPAVAFGVEDVFLGLCKIGGCGAFWHK